MGNNALNTVKGWTKLAAKLGVFLSDPELRSDVQDLLKDRTDYAKEKLHHKYEHAVDRLEAAGNALRGRTPWRLPAVGFLVGIGVGTGIGILLAPAAGDETRSALRDRAVDVKNRVADSAAAVTRPFTNKVSSMGMQSTGTGG